MSKVKLTGALITIGIAAALCARYVAEGSAAPLAGQPSSSTGQRATVRHKANSARHQGGPVSKQPAKNAKQTYAYWTKARMKSAVPPSMNAKGQPQPTTPAQPPSAGNGSSAPGAQLGAPSEGH
jgi:hypothetical protein